MKRQIHSRYFFAAVTLSCILVGSGFAQAGQSTRSDGAAEIARDEAVEIAGEEQEAPRRLRGPNHQFFNFHR